MRVAEVFGPTLQGEGPSSGQPAGFIRLWGCNLDCRWCDTPYTWDTTGKNGVVFERDVESVTMPIDELVAAVESFNVPRVVVTGGEPLVQRNELGELCAALVGAGFAVEVETNGTLAPDIGEVATQVRWNVSPKLGHAGTSRESIKDTLSAFARLDSVFKFVVAQVDDLDEIEGVLDRFPEIEPHQVWVMPEGRTADRIVGRLEVIADAVVARRWNLSTRLHVLCWGDERGV